MNSAVNHGQNSPRVRGGLTPPPPSLFGGGFPLTFFLSPPPSIVVCTSTRETNASQRETPRMFHRFIRNPNLETLSRIQHLQTQPKIIPQYGIQSRQACRKLECKREMETVESDRKSQRKIPSRSVIRKMYFFLLLSSSPSLRLEEGQLFHYPPPPRLLLPTPPLVIRPPVSSTLPLLSHEEIRQPEICTITLG